MEISERFKTLWRSQDDVNRCELIKNTAISVNRQHKKMIISNKAELEYGFNRTGIRGGKFTTLNANSQNTTRIYLELLEQLKYMVSTL